MHQLQRNRMVYTRKYIMQSAGGGVHLIHRHWFYTDHGWDLGLSKSDISHVCPLCHQLQHPCCQICWGTNVLPNFGLPQFV